MVLIKSGPTFSQFYYVLNSIQTMYLADHSYQPHPGDTATLTPRVPPATSSCLYPLHSRPQAPPKPHSLWNVCSVREQDSQKSICENAWGIKSNYTGALGCPAPSVRNKTGHRLPGPLCTPPGPSPCPPSLRAITGLDSYPFILLLLCFIVLCVCGPKRDTV